MKTEPHTLSQETIKVFRQKQLEYAKLKEQLELRVGYIVRKIFEVCGGQLNWWNWDDPERLTNGNVPSIDGDAFRIYIFFYKSPKNDTILLKDGTEWVIFDDIPTRWLWEDFEDELVNGLAAYKEQEQAKLMAAQVKKIENEKRRKEIAQQAINKLTPVEREALGI